MTHYTCTNCGGESDEPKICDNRDCLKEGQELTPCDCTDGEHGVDDEYGHARR